MTPQMSAVIMLWSSSNWATFFDVFLELSIGEYVDSVEPALLVLEVCFSKFEAMHGLVPESSLETTHSHRRQTHH